MHGPQHVPADSSVADSSQNGMLVVVPPYWQRHRPNASSLSHLSLDMHAAPIRLEDHTEEGSEQSKALWARAASIDDYVVITGSAPGIGDYVVYNCRVEALNVSDPLPFGEQSLP